MQKEKQSKCTEGIYHKTQVEFTYNSNHIEGNKLTQEQTRYILDTNIIDSESGPINVDDIMETANHFGGINS